MNMPNAPRAGFYTEEGCDLSEFAALTSRNMTKTEVPQAIEIAKNIPIYDAADLASTFGDQQARRGLLAEWAYILKDAAGVFVIRHAQPDHAAIDAATEVFKQIIAAEKASGASSADHFAAGQNDRVWNSLEKLCLADPATFIRYHASPAIDAASEAWLGPNYQMTAQINLVYPGGAPQQPHRDYHLGFQTAEMCATYPVHVHDLSPLMTLQGGLAHCDMSVESGPTQLLPFSQMYGPGYAAYRRDDFRAHFEAHAVQLPLAKGDALFFNPALFHAAGENRTTDVDRLVNLFQVSSAFGRSLERVDRTAMCKALYDPLLAAHAAADVSELGRKAVIASSAEGYSFPTNLDTDPPVGGLAPETQAALLARHLETGSPLAVFEKDLAALDARKLG
ncbi:MAG: phytanoyl-CoA dioxygenase family protein [Pseudomonadota bacterium]